MATLVLWVCSSARLRTEAACDTAPTSAPGATTDTASDAGGGSTGGGSTGGGSTGGGSTGGGSTGDPSTMDAWPDEDAEGVGDGQDGDSTGTTYGDGSEWTPAGNTTTDQGAVDETMADREASALRGPVSCSARCPRSSGDVGSA